MFIGKEFVMVLGSIIMLSIGLRPGAAEIYGKVATLAFYVVMILIYILFEIVVVNYRPVLIEERLEASYPSSTTLLVMSVMSATILQVIDRIQNKWFKVLTVVLICVFVIFMVIGRLISGVHWLSDIIGGALLSASLVSAYCFASKHFD